LHAIGHLRHSDRVELEVRIAWRRVLTVVLETVQVFVALATNFAAVGLLLLHADGPRVGNRGCRVNDGKGAVGVLLELLILMAVLGERVSECVRAQ